MYNILGEMKGSLLGGEMYITIVIECIFLRIYYFVAGAHFDSRYLTRVK